MSKSVKTADRQIVPVSRWWPVTEVLIELIVQIAGLCLVYLLFELVAGWVIGTEFNPDILLSIVVLPAIYILKDIPSVLEPFYVEVVLSDNNVTVKYGVFTRRVDSFSLDTVENIEMITTVLGRRFGYGSLMLYSYGSDVYIQNVLGVENLKAKIELNIQKEKNNKLNVQVLS
ncbi:MAG: PH domain-containing protein [Oceanospirillaceae bacterium]